MDLNIEDFYSEMAKLIKAGRLKRGLSQELMSENLNLTRTSIINLEKGRHRPSIYQLLQIAELIQVNFLELIPGNVKDMTKDVSLKTAKEIMKDIDEAVVEEPINKSSRKAVFEFLKTRKKLQ